MRKLGQTGFPVLYGLERTQGRRGLQVYKVERNSSASLTTDKSLLVTVKASPSHEAEGLSQVVL